MEINDIKNRLVLKSDSQKNIKALLCYVQNKEEGRIIDFSKVIPYPENIYLGPITASALSEYGQNNWYDFNKKNWGTFYNAYDAVSFGNILDFLTGWRPSAKVIEKLAHIFPEVDITLKYAARFPGGPIGVVHFSGDTMQKISLTEEEKQELRNSLWNKK